MKRILGLDLGTNSIGWALVDEAENLSEKSAIIKLGVRVNPLTTDEKKNFESGKKGKTVCADRTLKRSMRRNLQRYKLRRNLLFKILIENGFITQTTILNEHNNFSTFETYRLRAKAATDKISLEEFSRVLLMINKKRGYKSSRVANTEDEGQIIDGMDIAKKLYNENLTPGQFGMQQLLKEKSIPDFYRSDLKSEFNLIFDKQMSFYPELLTEKLKEELHGKKSDAVWAILEKELKAKGFELVGAKRQGKTSEQKIENYKWREKGLTQKLDLEQLAVVLQQINIQYNSSSGYLGAISDRSKELFFNNQTVGQYLQNRLENFKHQRIKGLIFYRQDYLDEFNIIWEKQAEFYTELTKELKKVIRDIVIFYQRPLKSQKHLISICELENTEIIINKDGKKVVKTVGSKVIPKSSPLFQDFKIWQILNNIEVYRKGQKYKKPRSLPLFEQTCDELETIGKRRLFQEEKELLFKELSFKSKLSKNDALKIIFANPQDIDMNYQNIEGNKTQAKFYEIYFKIIEVSGHGKFEYQKMDSETIYKTVFEVFNTLNINTDILTYNPNNYDIDYEQQAMLQLWHLLYSYQEDDSITGNEKLINKLYEKYGFEREYACILANLNFQDDYGGLCSKAIKKILPHLMEGNDYYTSCALEGYKHSKNSLTEQEIQNKQLKEKLELLPKNSLRNPVVEKIINQMINVVNSVTEVYGKPDEIRIELARELKKNAKERAELTSIISKTTLENEKIVQKLKSDFGLTHVSRNDIVRYKLYEELSTNGYKTLYSSTFIPKEKLFSKDFDVDHIIPQTRLFDDSFSNKTIELKDINIEKSNDTAYDFVLKKYGEDGLKQYEERIATFVKSGENRKTKAKKLMMKLKDIPDNFLERDLRDTQYIAKKAKSILESYVRNVVSTTGSVTERLREDWQLVDVMKEINFNKYQTLGLTEVIENREGQRFNRIKEWNKRNDHRHHALDALTVAFTKKSYIQYLNNLNARRINESQTISNTEYDNFENTALNTKDLKLSTRDVLGIEKKELQRDDKGKLRFKPPFDLDELRYHAKQHLESILVSIKAKNKVVTKNINKTKSKGGFNKKIQLTPRGQLHNETIYGCSKKYVVEKKKIGAGFEAELIAKVSNEKYRNALLARLSKYDNDPKKAFAGKNSLDKNPIWLNSEQTEKVPDSVKVVTLENNFTIRKDVNDSLSVDKVVDKKIRALLYERLSKFDNNPKKAFSNLDENPIWLNEKKCIAIKRVTISAVSNAVAIHSKKDKDGKLILDKNGNPQGSDFVNTGNNHHVAIYRDRDGNLHEKVVSFFEATDRANQGLNIIDKEFNKSEDWEFMFSLKQNEYFVFPNEQTGFNPKEKDLLNPENYHLISPNLFRVQKISTRNYLFNHHYQTRAVDSEALKLQKELHGITYYSIRTPKKLTSTVKVRLNHIGQIVSVGEY